MINFKSQNLLALAPLAGYTDLPFRFIAKRFGVDLTFSEMISSQALVRNSKKTFKMLEKSTNEIPYIVQIAGSNEEIIKEAVLILNDIDGIDGIDFNCGCPVPKLISQDSGSSLLRNLPKMSKLIEIIKNNSTKKYTSVKVRLGFDEKIPEQIAKAVEDSGADFFSVHGRTRIGGYKAQVDYEAIKKAKQSVKIPVFANGNIDSFKKAQEVKRITGCDGLMIGRGALGKPWIFYQIKNNIDQCPKELVHEIVMTHFDSIIEFYGKMGMRIFRKHLHTYSKGFQEASLFRNNINRIEDIKIMREEINNFFLP